MMDTVTDLAKARKHKEIEEFLKKQYPKVYLTCLVACGREEQVKREFRDSVDNYTIYIHNYRKPMLENLRKQGKLVKKDIYI